MTTDDQSVWASEPPPEHWGSVAVAQPPMSVTSYRVIYGDVAALLSGGLPDAPTPEVLRRNDGIGLFYLGQVNSIFGPPECGKTHISIGAAAEALTNGGKAVFIDLDHNGMLSTATRLLAAGVSPEILQDLERFRYKEPEDRQDLIETVADLRVWKPDVVIIDSVGELLPMMGLNSNSPDDFTIAHTAVLKPLAMSGACVVIIDHVAKNTESQAQGPTGTAAKARAIGGTMLRVTIKEQFAPGRGGSAYLNIKKDRHGGLRAASPSGDKEPLAGTFKMFPDSSFTVYAPTDGERVPEAAPGADLAELNALDPPPESVRDVMARLQWGNHRAALTLRVWREQIAAVTVTDTGGAVTATPTDTRNSGVTEQQATLPGEAA
jgi:hypothetical protein